MILAYGRVSTAEQAADGTTSLQEQERKTRAIAQLRGPVGPYDFTCYVDPGISGSVPLRERPAGKKMLADADKGDVIVAAKLDRLFRSASDALVTVEELHKRGVDVILADMGTEPVTANGSAKLFFGMLSVFAEFERERIGERMADGRRGKKARQGHLGGEAPYGFRVVGTGRDSRLEAVEQEQETIRVACRLWRLKRPAEVIRDLSQRGMQARSGKPFEIVQVKRMVQKVYA